MDQPAGGRRLMIVAVGFAVAALVTAAIAVFVVATRGGAGDHEVVAAKPPEPPKPAEVRVAAADVVRLERFSEVVTGTAGVRVRDPELVKKLGLQPDDVIVAVSGRPVTREFDVHEVIFNTSMMNVTMLYVELAGGRLVRWKLDGDLRSARYAVTTPYPSTGLGFGVTPIVPSTDPLIDSIVKIDDTHYTIPQATVDALFSSVAKLTTGARVVPAVKNGMPEGLKLYAIRPSSVYAHLGFSNGDTVTAINGNDVSDAAKALEAYTKLKGAKQVTVDLIRRGRPLTLTITVK